MFSAMFFGGGLLFSLSAEGGGGFLDKSYGVAKFMYSPGADYEHSGHVITGESAMGLGFDLGYKIMDSVSAELAFSYGSNSISKEDHTATDSTPTHSMFPLMATGTLSGTGTYLAIGLLGVYTYHINEQFSAVGKFGFVSESETLSWDTGDESASSTGVVYVLGGEYVLGGHNELVLEYEGSTVEGPKGANIFIGWKTGFGGH